MAEHRHVPELRKSGIIRRASDGPDLRYLVDSVRDAMVVFHYPSGPGRHQCDGSGEPVRHVTASSAP